MASKGQQFCISGHTIASFDEHQFCFSCWEKGKGFEPCVKGYPCGLCALITPTSGIKLPIIPIRRRRPGAGVPLPRAQQIVSQEQVAGLN